VTSYLGFLHFWQVPCPGWVEPLLAGVSEISPLPDGVAEPVVSLSGSESSASLPVTVCVESLHVDW